MASILRSQSGLAYLILLWVLALGAVAVLRQDIFGTVVTPRGKGRKQVDKHRAETRRKRRRGSSEPDTPTKLLITGGPLVGTSMKLGTADIVIGRSRFDAGFGRRVRLFAPRPPPS